MAGTFMLGEMKVRPGSYFNIQKKDLSVFRRAEIFYHVFRTAEFL